MKMAIATALGAPREKSKQEAGSIYPDPSLPLKHDYDLTCERNATNKRRRFVAIGFMLRRGATSLAAAPATVSRRRALLMEFLMQNCLGVFTKNASRNNQKSEVILSWKAPMKSSKRRRTASQDGRKEVYARSSQETQQYAAGRPDKDDFKTNVSYRVQEAE